MRRIKFFVALLLCLGLCLFICSCDESNDDVDENSAIDNSDSNDEPNEVPPKKKEKSYVVSFNAEMVENNSVGDDWSYGMKFNSEELEPGDTVVIDAEQTPMFVIYVSEYDASNSDITELTVDFENLELGEEVTRVISVVVTENDGRYKENIAVWDFTVTCKCISAYEQ